MLQEKLGKSALLLAAQNGQKEIIEVLIKEGADVMETDKVRIAELFYHLSLETHFIEWIYSTGCSAEEFQHLRIPQREIQSETPL